MTSEGLHRLFALLFYGRVLFIHALLPLIHAAPPHTIKRVLSIASGSYEGTIQEHDLPALQVPLWKLRGHHAAIMTLALQRLAKENPDVSFLADHPGTVITPSLAKTTGILGYIITVIICLFGRWITVPLEESGERHLFLCTSDAFPPSSGDALGVRPIEGLEIHGGASGEKGSGMYSLNWSCEGPGDKAVKLLKEYHKNGVAEEVWQHCQGELKRINNW